MKLELKGNNNLFRVNKHNFAVIVSLVLIISPVILVMLSPSVEATVIFTDGFESGSVDGWTTSGTAPSVQSSVKYDGDYAAQFTMTSDSELQKLITNTNTLYFNFSFRFTEQMPNGKASDIASFVENGVEYRMRLIYTNNTGTPQLDLLTASGSHLYPVALSVDTWYVFEMQYLAGGNDVLYLNGVPVITVPHSAGANIVNKVTLGTYWSDQTWGSTAYYDSVGIADTYMPYTLAPPSYSNPTVSPTSNSSMATFGLTVNNMNVNLHPNGQYQLGTNSTGSWTWSDAVDFSSTPQTISSIKVLPSTIGTTVSYMWNITDNNGNFVSTGMLSFNVTDDHVIGYTKYHDTWAAMSQRTFYAEGRMWVFWHNCTNVVAGGGYEVYSSSTDNQTWRSAENVNGRWTVSTRTYAVWFDGTYVHNGMVWLDQYHNYYLSYMRGTPYSNGTIIWGTEQTALTGETGVTYDWLHLSVDSNGYPWMAYESVATNSSIASWILKSSSNDGSWTTQSGFPYEVPITPTANPVSGVFPLDDGKAVVITFYDGYLSAFSWNGDNWNTGVNAPIEVTGESSGIFQWSAVPEGDVLHITLISHGMGYINYNYSTNTFSDVTVLSHNGLNAFSHLIIVLDPNTSNLYIFCTYFTGGEPLATSITYASRISDVWSTNHVLEYADIAGGLCISGSNIAQDNMITLMFIRDMVDSWYEVRAAYLLLQSMPEPSVSPNPINTRTQITVTVETAGETLLCGEPVYMGEDGKYYAADASDASTIGYGHVYLNIINATTNGKCVLLMTSGDIASGSWSWTIGQPVYVSATAGALTQTKPTALGTMVYVVGIAVSETVIRWNNPTGVYTENT